MKTDKILLDHGSGGKVSHRMMKVLLLPVFDNPIDTLVKEDRPDLNGRKAILELHVKGVKLDADVNLEAVARATAGLSGADLANIVNEAALQAIGATLQRQIEVWTQTLDVLFQRSHNQRSSTEVCRSGEDADQ